MPQGTFNRFQAMHLSPYSAWLIVSGPILPVGPPGEGIVARLRAEIFALLRLALTPAAVAADNSGEPEVAVEMVGLIALKDKAVTADARQRNRRAVVAIDEGSSDSSLALKAN